MSNDVHEQISRLEDRIEQLAEKIERCRKIMLAARGAIAVAGVLALAMMAGVIRFDALPLLTCLSLLLGGVVTLGSNSSTLDEAAVAMKEAEAQRAALIGQIDLRLVGGSEALGRLSGPR
jgi:hypothetical protein